MSKENEVVVVEEDEFGDVLHHFFINAKNGAVWLGHEVAQPSQGMARREDDIVLLPEKARALGELLIRYAGYAEK